jgi:transcription elongation GreA/GreB family factor
LTVTMQHLEEELARAKWLPSSIAPNVVTMNAKVLMLHLDRKQPGNYFGLSA